MLRAALAPVYQQYSGFGYSLEITPGAVRHVAEAIAAGIAQAGPRTGTAWLVAAANRGLMQLLNAHAARGTAYTLRADDIAVPRRGGAARSE